MPETDAVTIKMRGQGARTVPATDLGAALKDDLAKLRSGKRRAATRGAPAAQRDVEDPDQAGPHPAQLRREAEARGIVADRLRSILERVERLEEERKALSSDIKDIMKEAKSAGFHVKVVRALLRIRRQEPAEVEEFETLLDLYRRALGM